MWRARCARRWERNDGDADDRKRAGRALGAAAQGAAKVTGRADYVHNIRLPKMLIGKIFRSTVALWPHQVARRFRGEGVALVIRVVTIDDVKTVIPNPFYGPAFHDQPILAAGKVHYVGEPVAVVLASDPHIAEEAASLIEADYEELPAVFDEVEAMTPKAVVHDELKPAGTFPGPASTSRARRTPTSRSTSICVAAIRTRPSPRPSMCSSIPSAASRCCMCRSNRSCPPRS